MDRNDCPQSQESAITSAIASIGRSGRQACRPHRDARVQAGRTLPVTSTPAASRAGRELVLGQARRRHAQVRAIWWGSAESLFRRLTANLPAPGHGSLSIERNFVFRATGGRLGVASSNAIGKSRLPPAAQRRNPTGVGRSDAPARNQPLDHSNRSTSYDGFRSCRHPERWRSRWFLFRAVVRASACRPAACAAAMPPLRRSFSALGARTVGVGVGMGGTSRRVALAGSRVVPSFGSRMVCTKCGAVGADVRPNWREREG